MRVQRFLIGAVLMLTSSAALAQTQSEQNRAKMWAMVTEEIGAFEADQAAWRSKYLSSASELAATAEDVAATGAPSFDLAMLAGSLTLDVADAARKRGCKAEAERLYDHVIQVYVGSGYAALRQRTEIGIGRL